MGLLEDWFMGEVLEQMESKGFLLFLFLWILPLLLTISLFAAGVWVRNLIKNYKTKVASIYQPQKSGQKGGLIISESVSFVIGAASGLKFELKTNNENERLLEAKVPIQSARFIKPRDIVVRPDYLPVMIECENSFRKRMRNKILSVATPRIIVKQFTEKGIIWDEDNTIKTDIVIEFYPK